MNSMKKIEKKYVGRVACGECGSRNTVVNSVSIAFTKLATLFLLSAGVLIWIPVVGWVSAPVAVLLSGVCYLIALIGMFTNKYAIVCNDCKSQFTVDKKEYKEMIKRS